ncbi:MAG TPA: EamA family transporter [Actinomycetota bacterium]
MIYGLVAALGWGLADFFGALGGRRMGSLPAVVVGQVLSVVFMTVLLVSGGHDAGLLAGAFGLLVLNGLASMTAYASHYRALELGPVAVVSPIGAGYAVVGVALAIVVLGERPSGLALVGMAVTVVGSMLVSTDLTALRAGLHERAPGLPWAIVSSVTFGVAGFLLARVVLETGNWVVGLWASRCAMIVAFLPLVILRRRDLRKFRTASLAALAFAAAAGLADILGVTSYSFATEEGNAVSILLASSAVFPVIAVALSMAVLKERLALNQLVGVACVVGGLLLLGFGTR